MPQTPEPSQPFRERLHEIIFEADTPAGKLFDVALIIAIIVSVASVMMETVEAIGQRFGGTLLSIEWTITILFTVEYVLRLISTRRPLRYALSFFGIVDLLAILPSYLTLVPFLGDAHSLLVIRALRLLRIFRVFKLGRFVSEGAALREAIWASRAKIIVFLLSVLIVVVIMGSTMYLVEGDESGFTSIPQSAYWAIVTMTTVGYGDIAPVTPLGKVLAAIIMILGYSFIIVPTGIVSAEIALAHGRPVTTQVCPTCTREGHDLDAAHCKFCGAVL